MTILLTGGAGYIGSHINKELSQRGYATLVFDNLVNGHREFVKWGEFFRGDLLDCSGLSALFGSRRIDAVIHLAGYAYVGESVADPQKYYLNNVVGSLNLLKTMLLYDVKNIIFSSSCATYGVPAVLPIEEGHTQSPVNPYGWSKLIVEQMLRDFESAYGLHYVILRYFNAAGADLDSEIGEWHTPETHVIPRLVAAAYGSADRFPIYGLDYGTPDGTCIRDYVHVSDIAAAHSQALEYLLESHTSNVFNIGIGKGHSVRDLISVAQHVTGQRIPVANQKRRPGDPPVLISSGEKCRKILGWKAMSSDLVHIIETAKTWYLHHEKNLVDSPRR
jgi:UDP-glucose 4-epimerase